MTDRRTTIKLIVAAAAAMPALRARATDHTDFQPDPKASGDVQQYVPFMDGYGPDPNLIKAYERGEFWPLTLNPEQRQLAAALSDLIVPADARSPAASAVGVVDFIDEWISAPYPQQRTDRAAVLNGFTWMDGEARRRYERPFAGLHEAEQRVICDSICNVSRAAADLQRPARFFALYRNLTAAGFYTTRAGRKDLRYIGNTPLTHFDGPPLELLRKLGLA
ncbi:MAG: gluconate 2-dehydrogenase subunit 3 family protein [Steroidobacteraceae bacterium]